MLSMVALSLGGFGFLIWQSYRKKKSLRGDFLAGTALMDYWMTERDIHKAMLEKMGAL